MMSAVTVNSIGRRKIALLIGNNLYTRAPLNNCVNDANDLSNAFKSIGFAVTTETNLIHEKMQNTIKNFINDIEKGDFVVFFFSGHGVQYNNDHYLIPCDDNEIQSLSDLKYRATNVQRTRNKVLDRNPSMLIYLLDCCRTFVLPKLVECEGISSEGIVPMDMKAGTIVAFACSPGKKAADKAPNGRNGMFTYHLLQRITQPNEDIITTLLSVANDVTKNSNGKQIPHTISTLAQRGICLLSAAEEATRQSN